jgi:hypothetical protein
MGTWHHSLGLIGQHNDKSSVIHEGVGAIKSPVFYWGILWKRNFYLSWIRNSVFWIAHDVIDHP